MRQHLACRDQDGEWRTACGAHTQRVVYELGDVTCAQCRCTTAFKVAAIQRATSQNRSEGGKS